MPLPHHTRVAVMNDCKTFQPRTYVYVCTCVAVMNDSKTFQPHTYVYVCTCVAVMNDCKTFQPHTYVYVRTCVAVMNDCKTFQPQNLSSDSNSFVTVLQLMTTRSNGERTEASLRQS